MYAFFGFFDRGFRSYDFDLGMYEARRQLERFTCPAPGAGAPRPVRLAGGPPRGARRGRILGALRLPPRHLRRRPRRGGPLRRRATCDNQRILAQVSLDRLWDRCRPDSRWSPPPAEFDGLQGGAGGRAAGPGRRGDRQAGLAEAGRASRRPPR